MNKKRVYYRSERELEGLRWTAKAIDFGVSVAIMAAFNQMLNAYLVLTESKLLAHKARQFANRAYSKMTIRKRLILATMKDEKFYDSFAEASIDATCEDVGNFKQSLFNTLQNEGVPNAKALAEAETARVLLRSAHDHYVCILQRAVEKFGYSYAKHFTEYDALDVFLAWNTVCEDLYHQVSFNLNNENTDKWFGILQERLASGFYIEGSVKEALMENPDFANEIKIIEEQ